MSHSHEKQTMLVVVITAMTMVAEIIFGLSTKSMALLADGIHMGFENLGCLVANQTAGWHLIGCPYPTATPVAGVLDSNFSVVKNFSGFWMPNGTANSIENLEPGAGYFIKK